MVKGVTKLSRRKKRKSFTDLPKKRAVGVVLGCMSAVESKS